MLVWLTLPFYDFCGFRSVAVNSVYKLQFFTFIEVYTPLNSPRLLYELHIPVSLFAQMQHTCNNNVYNQNNVCQLVASCLWRCDELTNTMWRVDPVTSWSCDELTGSHSLYHTEAQSWHCLWQFRKSRSQIILRGQMRENVPKVVGATLSDGCSSAVLSRFHCLTVLHSKFGQYWIAPMHSTWAIAEAAVGMTTRSAFSKKNPRKVAKCPLCRPRRRATH